MDKSAYGSNLKKFLDENNISLREASIKTEIEYEAFRNLVYNRSYKINLFNKIADTFNVPISVFLSSDKLNTNFLNMRYVLKITQIATKFLTSNSIDEMSFGHINDLIYKSHSYVMEGGENLESFVEKYIKNLIDLKLLKVKS